MVSLLFAFSLKTYSIQFTHTHTHMYIEVWYVGRWVHMCLYRTASKPFNLRNYIITENAQYFHPHIIALIGTIAHSLNSSGTPPLPLSSDCGQNPIRLWLQHYDYWRSRSGQILAGSRLNSGLIATGIQPDRGWNLARGHDAGGRDSGNHNRAKFCLWSARILILIGSWLGSDQNLADR